MRASWLTWTRYGGATGVTSSAPTASPCRSWMGRYAACRCRVPWSTSYTGSTRKKPIRAPGTHQNKGRPMKNQHDQRRRTLLQWLAGTAVTTTLATNVGEAAAAAAATSAQKGKDVARIG